MTLPYQILEVANCHGGSLSYLLSLLDEFAAYKKCGIKFQPLHPDRIATKDFPWYNVYQELLFSESEWTTILNKAGETKEIWLDLFDTYGVEIFEQHRSRVKGIKLQPSILYNESVINALEVKKLNGHILIINVSALEITEIEERLHNLTQRLAPDEIWIEVGFQSFPTELQDSAYVKIDVIKNRFNTKIVFADHADGKSDDAIWLPVIAAMHGVDVVEKHILHSTLETKYDHYSSIDYIKYGSYMEKLQAYLALKNQPFINDREKKYLSSSIQIPISNKPLQAGNLISLSHDLEFKRSGQQGLNTREIKELQQSMHILSHDVPAGKTFKREDFKKAIVGAIVACRLKSSRLEKKALLKIGELSSVERCLQSCLNFSNTHYTVLATSDLETDADLANYTYSPAVVFHTGDPEDVIRRYLGITDKLGIDVIVRVTADIPFVSAEITKILLASHFEKGADYTVATQAAVGTTVEIINTNALKKIKSHFASANYSEYMTWYFQNNPEHFKLNFVDLPERLIRDYRLTLDYQEDLDMFNVIQKHLDDNKLPSNIESIFDFLDKNPDVAKLNGHITLKYKTDQTLIDTLNKETKIK